ncbi:hypothetical protein SRHO_G00335560 [Serrasalmus rhombeus]
MELARGAATLGVHGGRNSPLTTPQGSSTSCQEDWSISSPSHPIPAPSSLGVPLHSPPIPALRALGARHLSSPIPTPRRLRAPLLTPPIPTRFLPPPLTTTEEVTGATPAAEGASAGLPAAAPPSPQDGSATLSVSAAGTDSPDLLAYKTHNRPLRETLPMGRLGSPTLLPSAGSFPGGVQRLRPGSRPELGVGGAALEEVLKRVYVDPHQPNLGGPEH